MINVTSDSTKKSINDTLKSSLFRGKKDQSTLSTPSELELGGKSQTWSQFLLRITSECVLQKPRQHSLWRIWFGSCWLLGPGEPISNGQGGVSESCQSCYPTCCSCSGMVQSGIITARSKTGRLQISSRGETRGAVESCHSHPSLDLGPTWLKVFFKKAKGWPLTRQMNMNRAVCLFCSSASHRRLDSRWRGSWRMRCNKGPQHFMAG